MKKIFPLIIIFFAVTGYANNPISVCSWNIENFGKSKSDKTIKFIANTLKGFDVIAIVEVVAGNGGPQAVARLNDALNRKGAKWDYTISDPTTGSPYKSERYAILWKTSKVTKIGRAWLENNYQAEIEREPFMATFKSNGKEFTIVAFHARPKAQQPEKELKYFQYLPRLYPDKNLLFCGDFNCPQSNSVFNPLKTKGYKPILAGQKTSLRQKCIKHNCLASEYDNLFYNTKAVKYLNAGIIHFYTSFQTLKEARKVSDHIPIYFRFSLN